MSDFGGIEAKIDRAGQHIDALNDEIRAWAERDPYTVLSDPGGPALSHRAYLKFRVVPDTQRWGLLLGDAVHNLRSALDHLIYALAVRVSGLNPPPGWRRLAFPILDESKSWKGKRDRRLKSLTAPMRAAIEAVQPYRFGPVDSAHRDLLWMLSELDNADKHREIRPLAAVTADMERFLRTVTGGPMTVKWFPTVPLEDGATILTVTSEVATTEMEPDGNTTLGVSVDVGAGPPHLVHVLADSLFDRTARVVLEFQEQFFPETL